MKLSSQGPHSNCVSLKLFGFRSELEYRKDSNYRKTLRLILSINSKQTFCAQKVVYRHSCSWKRRILSIFKGLAWDVYLERERFHMTSRAAILVFKNNKTAAMLVFQTNPMGIDLFSYVNAFFCSNKFARYIMGDVQVAYCTITCIPPTNLWKGIAIIIQS